MSRLIIIRGNSGSGKTTVAERLRREMGYGTMLIQQDVVRREILRVKDVPNNPARELIVEMARYGKKIGYDVILEGILAKHRYGDVLERLVDEFNEVFVYYFDIPFEETLKRHETKSNAHEFGEKEMCEWWKEQDVLSENDRIITHDMSEDEIINRINHEINS